MKQRHNTSNKVIQNQPCFRKVAFHLISSDCSLILLPPANKVCEGYVFTCVCHSEHGGYSNMPCRYPGGGVVSQHALQVSRPTPKEEAEGSGLGGGRECLQAHIQWRSPGPHPRGVGIPACTEADTPCQQMVTAAGGTHPTGMHSCSILHSLLLDVNRP